MQSKFELKSLGIGMVLGGVLGAGGALWLEPGTSTARRRNDDAEQTASGDNHGESSEDDADEAQTNAMGAAATANAPSAMSVAVAETLQLDHASPAQVRAGYATLVRALQAARSAQASAGAANTNAVGSANQRGSRDQHERMYPATHEELAERAQRCSIMLDIPPSVGTTPTVINETTAQRYGISESERVALNDAIARVFTLARRTMTPLYVEATGDTASAATLTVESMIRELRDKTVSGEDSQLRRQLARELAGEIAPPSDLSDASAYERAMRFFVTLGDELEHTLGLAIGAERARELRAQNGGWPWGRWEMSGCPEDTAERR